MTDEISRNLIAPPLMWRAHYDSKFLAPVKCDGDQTRVAFFICVLHNCSGRILGLRPANERRRYKVTPSLIGWAQT